MEIPVLQNWNADKLENAIAEKKAIIVKFWKKGCGACKLATPALERLEKSYGNKIDFAQVCLDDNEELYELLDTEVLPTFFAFYEAKLQGKLIGFKGLVKLQTFLSESFPNL